MLDTEWFFVLDDDDWLTVDAVEAMYEEANNDVSFVHFKSRHHKEGQVSLELCFDQEHYTAGRMACLDVPVPQALLINRNAYDQAGGYDEQFTWAFDDVDLVCRLLQVRPAKASTKMIMNKGSHPFTRERVEGYGACLQLFKEKHKRLRGGDE